MDMLIFSDSPFNDHEAMKVFLFSNSESHHQVAAALAQKGLKVDSVPLTEMGKEQDWLQRHDAIHTQELALLGISQPANLAEVDLQNESEYRAWMYSHALLHQYVNIALGLS